MKWVTSMNKFGEIDEIKFITSAKLVTSFDELNKNKKIVIGN